MQDKDDYLLVLQDCNKERSRYGFPPVSLVMSSCSRSLLRCSPNVFDAGTPMLL